MKFNISIIIILLFQGSIENIIPIMNYFDEFLIIILVIRILFMMMKRKNVKISKNHLVIIFFICLYLTVGIVSNMNSKFLVEFKAYLSSGILSMKFVIIFILSSMAFKDMKVNFEYLKLFYRFLNIILNIYGVLLIINIPTNIFKSWGIRYGIITTVSAGFSHPAELDFLAISIMVIQTFLIEVLKKDKKKYIFIYFKVLIIIILTGRIKSIAFFVLFVTIVGISNYRKKLTKKQLILPIFIILYIAKERIISELLEINSVRGTLLTTGIKIAKDYFPIGSGFGTFGSDTSRKIYSPIYFIYEINKKYGLSRKWPAYITDSHWASIIGETGVIGTSIYICILYLISKQIFENGKKFINKISICSLWVYGLMSSISDTILISYRGVALIVITNFIMAIVNNIEKLEEE